MKLSTWSSLAALVLATALAACTKPNPAVCCLDAADCDEVGIPEVRGCSQGLACVDHQCTVPSCAEAGCGAEAPVCNVVTDVCDPCVEGPDCERFVDTPVCGTTGACVQCLATPDCAARASTPVCDAATQTCVECLGPSDCGGLEPICDAMACRAPRSDAECPSGAIGDDGFCVPDAEVVYLSPTGTNVGSCNRAVPCQTLAFAVPQTSGIRYHIVFAPGQYFFEDDDYDSVDTTAPSLFLHGHGAEILGPTSPEGCIVGMGLPSTLRDLTVTMRGGNQQGICLRAGPSVLEAITVNGAGNGGTGIAVSASATARDVRVFDGYMGIRVQGGSLTLDRAVLHKLNTGLYAETGSSVQATNLLTYELFGRGLDFQTGSSGTVASSTIATSGTGPSPRAANCPTAVLIRSSIVWAPGSTGAPISGCNVSNVIAGPTSVGGAMNIDPLFANMAQHDYHLAAGSPARDAVDSGPATDYEGHARPQGARFDIGADEAMP